MIEIIKQIKQARTFILSTLNECSLEQLNKVPTGFNNNIAWNLGHMVAAQQGVCYSRSGLKMQVEQSYFDMYKPGTKPEKDITAEEFETIKKLLLETPDLLMQDYEKKIFTNFTPFTTRYGVDLKNIEDAISFILYHEGLHSGMISSIKRLVK